LERLVVNSLIEAVRDALIACGITCGIYDTMAPTDSEPMGRIYPYIVISVIDIPDESNWTNSAQQFYFQIDTFTGQERGADRSSGRRVGTLSRAVRNCLNLQRVADPTGLYADFWPEMQALRRMKEDQNVWRVSIDFLAYVVLV
ncbi:unnamed protein product, partial [marine sediment metagenome]